MRGRPMELRTTRARSLGVLTGWYASLTVEPEEEGASESEAVQNLADTLASLSRRLEGYAERLREEECERRLDGEGPEYEHDD